MASKPASCFDTIAEPGSFDHCDDQIMDGRQNADCCAFCRPGGIFLEGDIPAVMEPGFNLPMLASDLEQLSCGSLSPGQTGQPVLGFTTGFIHFALAHPAEFAFQAIDLP